jgi:hypothetical protein
MCWMTKRDFQTAFEDILGIPHRCLKDSDNRKTIGTWSSIADAQIVAYVASDVGVEPDAELMEAETLGELVRILDARNAFC